MNNCRAFTLSRKKISTKAACLQHGMVDTWSFQEARVKAFFIVIVGGRKKGIFTLSQPQKVE